MLSYVNRSKIKKKSLIVVTSFIILLLIYFTIIDFYIISIHDNYKIAATSFATITSRASLTLFLAMYYIESILTYNPEYICGSNGKPSIDDIIEDGFYVSGEALPFTGVDVKGRMYATPNEVDKSARDGFVNIYTTLEAGKSFSFTEVKGASKKS